MDIIENTKLATIGLCYVDSSLAVEFGRKYSTLGFDINTARLAELNQVYDLMLEVSDEELAQAKKLRCNNQLDDLKACNIFIVTLHSLINDNKHPYLTPLIKTVKRQSPKNSSALKLDFP